MTTLMPDQTPEGWGKAASAYDRSIVDRITVTYAAEAIRALGVQPGDRLLDVATGPGTAALAAADAAPVQVALLASLGDRTGLVRDALLSMLHDRFGDGPVVFECEALLGLGVKG